LPLSDLCPSRAKILCLSFPASGIGCHFILCPCAFLCPLSFVRCLPSLVSFLHDHALLSHARSPLSPSYCSDCLFLWLWALVFLFSSSPFAPTIYKGSHCEVARIAIVMSPHFGSGSLCNVGN
jgi:hypothetical protein